MDSAEMRLLFDGGGGETGRITRAVVLNIASASESMQFKTLGSVLNIFIPGYRG